MIKHLSMSLMLLLSLGLQAQILDMALVKNMEPRNIGPTGMSGRITAIDAVDANPESIYVGSASGGLWKSTSAGVSWEPIFDHEVTASIGAFAIQQSNPAVVWAGTGETNPRNSLNGEFGIYKTLDGGKTWTCMGLESTRHIYRVNMDGNDGGLNITRDGSNTWRFVENLPVGQFYHVAVDDEFPYNVYGGMQDNGSWRGPAYVWRAQGIRNAYWQEISFGDGFDVVPDRDDSRYGWSMSQQGFVSRYDWIMGDNYVVRPTAPDPKVKLRFNWNAAIDNDPFDSGTLYFCSQFVHRSIDKGLTWTVISPDLTTNDPKKQNQSEV